MENPNVHYLKFILIFFDGEKLEVLTPFFAFTKKINFSSLYGKKVVSVEVVEISTDEKLPTSNIESVLTNIEQTQLVQAAPVLPPQTVVRFPFGPSGKSWFLVLLLALFIIFSNFFNKFQSFLINLKNNLKK